MKGDNQGRYHRITNRRASEDTYHRCRLIVCDNKTAYYKGDRMVWMEGRQQQGKVFQEVSREVVFQGGGGLWGTDSTNPNQL